MKQTIDTQIKELSDKLTEAEKNNRRLSEEKEILQEEKNKLIQHQYHLDYQVENQKKRIEDFSKTLKLYETENRAMRELLRLWI